MARLIWRRWAAGCLVFGAVVAPLFLEVFSGGSWLRFAALPFRWAWLALLALPIVREGWISGRALAVALLGFCLLVSGITIVDLLGFRTVHPGWFLGLEWFQRPVYPWVDLLPRGYVALRPSYLWVISLWNVIEGTAVAFLLWRTTPPGAESGVDPTA